MNYPYILAGFVFAVVLVTGFMLYPNTTGVDYDTVCSERLGGNWTHEETHFKNETGVSIVCTNGTATREIGVKIAVNT